MDPTLQDREQRLRVLARSEDDSRKRTPGVEATVENLVQNRSNLTRSLSDLARVKENI